MNSIKGMLLDMLKLIFSRYCYLIHTAPLSIYVFYIIFKDICHPIIGSLTKIGLVGIGLGTTCSILGCVFGIHLEPLISFTWSYPGPVTWGLFFMTYYFILIQKEENSLTSFTLATLATVGGGWLYEVSFFHPLSMFMGRWGSYFYNNVQILCILLLSFELRKKIYDPNTIIYIILLLCMFLGWGAYPYPNGQIICLILLGYELIKRGFKPNRLIFTMLTVFMIYSISLFLDKDSLWHFCRECLLFLNLKWTPVYAQNVKWIYRVPASLFLLSLLSGVKKNA